MTDNLSDREFSSMDENKQKEIASKGGKVTAGKNLSPQDRARGGKHSHNGGRKS